MGDINEMTAIFIQQGFIKMVLIFSLGTNICSSAVRVCSFKCGESLFVQVR